MTLRSKDWSQPESVPHVRVPWRPSLGDGAHDLSARRHTWLGVRGSPIAELIYPPPWTHHLSPEKTQKPREPFLRNGRPIAARIARFHRDHAAHISHSSTALQKPKHVVLPHVSASTPQSMHFPGVVYSSPRHRPSLCTRVRGVTRSHHGGWVAATRCCNVRPSHCGDCARAPIRPLMPARRRFQAFWLGFWVKSFLVLGVLLERCGAPMAASR